MLRSYFCDTNAVVFERLLKALYPHVEKVGHYDRLFVKNNGYQLKSKQIQHGFPRSDRIHLTNKELYGNKTVVFDILLKDYKPYLSCVTVDGWRGVTLEDLATVVESM